MNNGQSGSSTILSVIQPVTIDTMLNNNWPFFCKKNVTCKQGLSGMNSLKIGQIFKACSHWLSVMNSL